MSAVLWIVGGWLLVSLVFGMVFGCMCSLNGSDTHELPISDGMPITAALSADLAALDEFGIPA
jgi:hypothetical protein